MRPFLTESDNTITIHGAEYTLVVTGHKIAVSIEQNLFATLDVRCAVPQTLDDDSGATPDHEPHIPTLVSVQTEGNKAVLTWENDSSLWQKKIYTLTCDLLRFRFDLTLCGNGRVDEIYYFSGNMAGVWGSAYEFQEGFTPCISWYNQEEYVFKASMNCHRWSVLMVPPMFCYAFKKEGITRRLGLGLVAERGEHNFQSFDYRTWGIGSFRTGFALVTDQHGHQMVNGQWKAPAIIGYGGDDQWDVLDQYVQYYFTTGIAKPKSNKPVPRFWHGPMVCGWIEQCALGVERGVNPTELATEAVYEDIAAKVKRYGLHPTALIIDDKWQSQYATDIANPDKFPDMRAFVERRRAEGLHTMLWFKLWDGDGWDKELCVTADNGEVRIDPSQPAFLANLDEALHRILSADEGCYNCDGFKLDFAFWNPIGRKIHTHSGKYGVELLYEMQAYIYQKSKEIKPEALVNCSPCHPYFAHICDQARLHDSDYRNRNNREDLTMRAKLFATAMPGVLLDTDNAGFANYRDTMHWMLTQTLVGVPDLYALRGTEQCPMDEGDFAALAQLWDEYNTRIDAMYEA